MNYTFIGKYIGKDNLAEAIVNEDQKMENTIQKLDKHKLKWAIVFIASSYCIITIMVCFSFIGFIFGIKDLDPK